MELSPLARQKLERMGEVSKEEKAKMKLSEELKRLLADYFTYKLTPDDLWKRLKEYKEEGKGLAMKEAQIRLIDALRLEASEADFERQRSAILALETLKEEAKYPILELNLDSIESLRKEYKEQREQTFNMLKKNVERQIQLAAQQVIRQTGGRAAIDIDRSVEANVKASSEWKSFTSRHEKVCGERFQSFISKLREAI